MADDPSLLASLAARAFGTGAGAFVALVFIPPKTIKEFVSRVSVSSVVGVIFAHPAREYIGWENETEHTIAAAAMVSFASWWILGVFVRYLKAKDDLSRP